MATTVLNISSTGLPLIFGAVGSALGMGVFWGIAACLLTGGYAAGRKVRRQT